MEEEGKGRGEGRQGGREGERRPGRGGAGRGKGRGLGRIRPPEGRGGALPVCLGPLMRGGGGVSPDDVRRGWGPPPPQIQPIGNPVPSPPPPTPDPAP